MHRTPPSSFSSLFSLIPGVGSQLGNLRTLSPQFRLSEKVQHLLHPAAVQLLHTHTCVLVLLYNPFPQPGHELSQPGHQPIKLLTSPNHKILEVLDAWPHLLIPHPTWPSHHPVKAQWVDVASYVRGTCWNPCPIQDLPVSIRLLEQAGVICLAAQGSMMLCKSMKSSVFYSSSASPVLKWHDSWQMFNLKGAALLQR